MSKNKIRLAQKRSAAAKSIEKRLTSNVKIVSRNNPVERPYTEKERAQLQQEYTNIMAKLRP